MHSVGREHLRVGERAPGTTRRTQPPTTMSGAWIRHLQHVAGGGATSSSAGAGRETEAADRSQVQRAAVDEGLRSPTRPLDPAPRGEMEQRFGGADFSGVRVHDEPVSQRAAAAVEARAFTSGAHIVDGGGMSRSAEHEHPSGHAEHDHAHSHAGSTFVQRVQQSAATEEPVAEQAEGPEQSGQQAKGAAVIARLSQSIEQHTVQSKVKKNVFAPGTWWPEQWMVAGPARLRKTLDRRVMRGETFNDQDLDDIKHLSQVNAQWLEAVGIGTYEQAEKYAQGRFDTWLTLSAGKRVLTATLAVRANHPGVREAGRGTPISPDYTLGRFMLTQAPGTSPEEKQSLERERDQQIRETAVDTLHPAGIPSDRLHPDGIPEAGPTTAKGKGRSTESDFAAKDARAREMLTKVLLILQNGLKLYDPKAGAHVADYEKDVIRALAHGGRVNIRIPALRSADEPAYSLPEFLGVTQDDRTNARAGDVIDRGFATHRTSIGSNKEDKPGAFKEKGGPMASVTNMLSVGADRPDLWGQNISGGGLGSKDWNGDVVLPNGSYGHMLLVHHRPTMRKDGSLQIGIETLAPHATSPVGYEHDFRSTEATANPESVMHGHKGDKVGSGGLGRNERLVELAEMGKAHSSGDWRTFLDEIKKQWDAALAETEDGSQARRALYEGLVGPRTQPKS